MKKEFVKKSYEDFHSAKSRKSELFKAGTRYEFLKELMKGARGKVLVVGCGSKYEMSIINDKCEGIGLDISEVAIEKSKKRYPRFKYIVGDAMDMPFGEETMDYIICSETIEHLPDDVKFLESANKILKKGGVLILTTPNWISTWGIARLLGELILRRPVTSGGQPIDHWSTYWSLKNKVEKHFEIKKHWGLWYLPPFGLGKFRLPVVLEYPIFKAFYPIEKILRSLLPNFGHCLAFYCVKK